MIDITFEDEPWDDYLWYQKRDKNTYRKINELIASIEIDPRSGIGKPERLKHVDGETWSRRIDKGNRLTYDIIDEDTVIITRVKGHYDDH